MSTMLSDKVEQVNGATGSSAGGDSREDIRLWKEEVVAAIREDKTWGGGVDQELGAGSCQTVEALNGVKDAVKADAEEVMHRVEDWVIDHPLKSLCIATGVGFLLGVIWSH